MDPAGPLSLYSPECVEKLSDKSFRCLGAPASEARKDEQAALLVPLRPPLTAHDGDFWNYQTVSRSGILRSSGAFSPL
jgi:hypothetical protein